MGVVTKVRLQVRWNWHRATYVTRTEGFPALVERTAALAGLVKKHVEPEELLVGPPRAPLSEESASRWPASWVVVVSGDASRDYGQRLEDLATARGVPGQLVRADEPGVVNALQLASALIVASVAAWPQRAVLQEARRLRAGLWLIVSADDLGSAGLQAAVTTSDRVIAADQATAEALREGWPSLAVELLGADAAALLGAPPEVAP